ncbi:MAG: flagellar protein FlgN [Sphingomonadaceae bacterium]
MTTKQLTESSTAPCAGRCTELIEVMREQEQICIRLLELSATERASVLQGRVDLLEKATRDKGGLMEQMERLEQMRRGIALNLAVRLGLPTDASLVSLACRLGGQEGEELLEIRRRVAESVAKLKESNENNLLLMRKSLETVRDSLRQLRHAIASGDTYTRSGRQHFAVEGTLAVDCHV